MPRKAKKYKYKGEYKTINKWCGGAYETFHGLYPETIRARMKGKKLSFTQAISLSRREYFEIRTKKETKKTTPTPPTPKTPVTKKHASESIHRCYLCDICFGVIHPYANDTVASLGKQATFSHGRCFENMLRS